MPPWIIERIYSGFEWIDDRIGPDKTKYKRACLDDREMLMECVLSSRCFQEHNNFRFCIQDGADKECKALRHD